MSASKRAQPDLLHTFALVRATAKDYLRHSQERLLATPPVALERCHTVAVEMACDAALALKEALQSLDGCTPELASDIRVLMARIREDGGYEPWTWVRTHGKGVGTAK